MRDCATSTNIRLIRDCAIQPSSSLCGTVLLQPSSSLCGTALLQPSSALSGTALLQPYPRQRIYIIIRYYMGLCYYVSSATLRDPHAPLLFATMRAITDLLDLSVVTSSNKAGNLVGNILAHFSAPPSFTTKRNSAVLTVTYWAHKRMKKYIFWKKIHVKILT